MNSIRIVVRDSAQRIVTIHEVDVPVYNTHEVGLVLRRLVHRQWFKSLVAYSLCEGYTITFEGKQP